jgi:hypothetical protein
VGERLVDVLVDERPADLRELRDVVAMHHVDAGGAVVTQQRRPLVGALATPDDDDACAGEPVEADQVTGVRATGRRYVGVPLRKVDEVPDAGRGQHLVGPDRGAVLERGLEASVSPDEPCHQPLVDLEPLPHPEPLRVVEEDPDRDRVEVRVPQPPVLEERLEGVLTAPVEVPVRTGSQVHVRGHVLPPEGHRVAAHVRGDAVVAGEGGRREGVRTGADHEQVRAGVHGVPGSAATSRR